MITDAQLRAHYAARKGGEARWMLWIVARNLQTDLDEGMGFWQGVRARSFVIGGQTRTYYGFAGNLQFDAIRHKTGLAVRRYGVTLNGAATETSVLMRNYDFSQSPAEVHCAHMDPLSGTLLDTRRHFKGLVDEAPMTTPGDNGAVTVTLTLLSSVIKMTKTPNLMKSHASQVLLSGDQIRRDATVSQQLDDPWLSE